MTGSSLVLRPQGFEARSLTPQRLQNLHGLSSFKVDLYDLVIFDHFRPSDWRGNRDEF